MTRGLLTGLAFGALLTAGCASAPSGEPLSHARANANSGVEAVLGWRENAAGDLVVRVYSNGCTTKDSFDVFATGSPRAGWAFDVTLTRYRPDTCEAFLPQGVELTWTRDELGLPQSARLGLTNPVNANRGSRRSP